MDLGRRRLHRPADLEVGRAAVVGMDAALQAHLGRAALPGLAGAARDLGEVEVVGRPAQMLGEPALGEGAEAAAEVADVGVVDVAVDDVGDPLAADLLAQLVGLRGRPRRPRGRGRRTGARPPPRRASRPARARRRIAAQLAARRRRRRPRATRRRRRARDPAVLARVALAVGVMQHGRAHRRREPALRLAGRSADRSRAAAPAPCPRPRSRAAAARAPARAPPGLTWSGVTGEIPPQSSMPAASSRSSAPGLRLGGACRLTSGGSTRRATAIVQR